VAGPIDARLVRESRAARTHLGLAAVLGVLQAGLIIAQAVLLATVIARAAINGAGLASLRGELITLGGVLAARALVNAAFELSGRVGATRAMSELRRRLAEHLLLDAPGQRRANVRTGDLAASAVSGVDALEAYFAAYLPQLILACVVPVAVLASVATIDAVSAVILAVTIPVLITFMILIGVGTRAQTDRRLGALSLLSAHFLDVVRGLETLRAYRREHAQERILAQVGERYRRETMGTLRIAFMSSLVLELCAMLGTAIVAAAIGIQLCGGRLTLRAGLTVLLLAPELYGPLRQVGQQFHASADGTAAAERIFATLEQPGPVPARAARPALSEPAVVLGDIAFHGVSYEYPDRSGLALDHVDLTLAAGTMTALIGASGNGKSTIARLLLRFADPTAGTIRSAGTDLREIDLERWRRNIAWVPQHPTLFSGTLAENIRLGAPAAGDEQLHSALDAAGIGTLIDELPDGLDTIIGDGGRRVSAGQRQRIALARAFLRNAPLLILDEPTAHLDPVTAARLGETIERLARGRTVLLIVHDRALAARADLVMQIADGRIVNASAATASRPVTATLAA
jgi:ATP-binding cassette subfamily C protein CydD